MKATEDGGPAFPLTCQGPTTGPEFYYGMSLRDYFAGQALAGILAGWHIEDKEVARAAFRLADAMLKERAK